MNSDISALILCGGKGSRLHSVTRGKIPKPLVPISGKPIIQYVIEHLLKSGINDITLATGYKSEKIESFLKETYSDYDFKISNAGENASMLKRIVKAMPELKENFCLLYGDTFSEVDLDAFCDSHIKNNKSATFLTGKIQSPFGIVDINPQGEIEHFKEKPVFNYYIGNAIFNQNIKKYISSDMLDLEDSRGIIQLFHTLCENSQLKAFNFEGFQVTFNTMEEFKEADHKLKKYLTVSEEQS